MFGKFLAFMFGKNPDIFDADGTIRHKFPDDKWKSWKNRFETNEYDWHEHKGRGDRKSPGNQTKSKH